MNFENYLMDQHAKQYTGLDDEMIDDFNEWLSNIDVEAWIKFSEDYALKRYVDGIRRYVDGIKMTQRTNF